MTEPDEPQGVQVAVTVQHEIEGCVSDREKVG